MFISNEITSQFADVPCLLQNVFSGVKINLTQCIHMEISDDEAPAGSPAKEQE